MRIKHTWQYPKEKEFTLHRLTTRVNGKLIGIHYIVDKRERRNKRVKLLKKEASTIGLKEFIKDHEM